MSISMYQASVPVFLHGLGTLTHILRKGEAHAQETGADPASYVEGRLAPDMLTLAGQIQRASDTSKLALERISGVAAPKMEDNEKTFAELFARVERTAAYIGAIPETAARRHRQQAHRTEAARLQPGLHRRVISAHLRGTELLLPRHDRLRHPAPQGRAAGEARFSAAERLAASGMARRPRPMRSGAAGAALVLARICGYQVRGQVDMPSTE